jgi:outer membrane protein assembly factor BamB
MTRTSLALIGGLLVTAVFAGDWMQFRGPGAAGIAQGEYPTEWSASKNVRWKQPLPGRGLSCPVISAGKVYISACSGRDQEHLHTLCFDETSGKLLWQADLWSTGGTDCHPKTNMAAPTPVADAEGVYVLWATADLAAYTPDGKLRWYRSLVGDYPTITNMVGMASSPVKWKDVLIVPMDNAGESFLAGIDTATGKNRWKIDRPRDINWTTPLIWERSTGAEVIFQDRNGLVAHAPATGRKLWSYANTNLSTMPSPAPAGDKLILPGGGVIALEPPSADRSTATVAWQTPKLSGGYPTPLFVAGKVYGINSAGVLGCADAATGKVLWTERLKGPFAASPVAAGGKIYAVNEKGSTFVINPGADKGMLLATNELGDEILATPAFGTGTIFLRSDKFLYCIGSK